jgi:hypothetical protein
MLSLRPVAVAAPAPATVPTVMLSLRPVAVAAPTPAAVPTVMRGAVPVADSVSAVSVTARVPVIPVPAI